MKKISLTLIFSALLIFVVACGNDDNNKENNIANNSDNSTNQTEENNIPEDAEDEIHQVGDTAVVTSDIYDFDYEVTVNDYEITNESDKYDMHDFYMDYDKNPEGAYIVIVNVTIKNMADVAYVPNTKFSANMSEIGKEGGSTSNDDYFPEADEELEPGDSITGDIIYEWTINEDSEIEGFWFKYEGLSSEETVWELPNTVN